MVGVPGDTKDAGCGAECEAVRELSKEVRLAALRTGGPQRHEVALADVVQHRGQPLAIPMPDCGEVGVI